METNRAKQLLENGEAHGLSAVVLFEASTEYAQKIGVEKEKIEDFTFNGTCSLSVHYLVGLGLELILKAAYIASGGGDDDQHLRRKIGHDLIKALEQAREIGFESKSEHLEDMLGYMNEPYKHHYLRYGRPDGIYLPSDIRQVAEVFETLRAEVRALL